MVAYISPMEPPAAIVHRKRLLTNEAAEYVEHGAATRLVASLPESIEGLGRLDASEFSPSFNRFISKDSVPDISNCYRESEGKKLQFQQKLAGFVDLLRANTDLHIEIRDPKDFDLAYILRTIDKVEQHRDEKKSYKPFLQKCFRKYERNKIVVEGILSLVPDDLYGSLISGGFTVILACLESYKEKREAIEKFLGEIQEKLDGIYRLTYVHSASYQVHSRADSVLVSVFAVLEQILDKIAKKLVGRKRLKALGDRARGFLKRCHDEKPGGDSNNATLIVNGSMVETDDTHGIPDALKELQRRVDRFQDEVDLAEKELIGNTNKRVLELQQENEKFSKAVISMCQEVDSKWEGTHKGLEEILMQLKNALYLVFRSNPFINNRTAQVDYKEMEQSRLEQAAESKRSLQERNNRVTKKFLYKIRGLDYDAMTDINDCLQHIERLDGNEKNISGRIMSSEELNDWLRDSKSSFFMVDLQTPPSDLNNPLSFTSALLAMSLRSAGKSPMLAFFCKHRNNEDPNETNSGPIAMIKSLNGQLLEFMNLHRPDVDLSLLEDQSFFKAKKLKHNISLFRALLLLLPRGDTVFVILDSLSCLSGDDEEAHEFTGALNRIMESQRDICIRVLVTDPLVDSPLREVAHWQLHVADNVSGPDTIDVDDSTERFRKGLGSNKGESDSSEDEYGEDKDDSSNEDNSSNEDDNSDENDSSDEDEDEYASSIE
ncbi:hypothetical protein F5Y10DRAFT_290197 [Nemania abortiva]|nr:hypothetical protein F5Y10DRAFT_290197 [Nemania abortiva]